MNPTRNIEYENLSGLNAPFIKEYEETFSALLKKGWFILGEQVAAFEEEFAAFLNAPKFLGLASGLDALEIPFKILDFPENSEIIVPSNTYIATINAILNTGHKPVFVEPDLKTYLIDPAKIREKITEKTRAIMVVHLYGKPCDMDPILALCNEFDLELIEDCAQSHGAKYKGQQTGTFGFGAFSFYPTKNLGALGDAGGLSLSNPQWYDKVKAWRNYGSFVKYQNEYVGDNSRLDEIQAGFLRIKLKALQEITSHKQKLAALYDSLLDGTKVVKPIRSSEWEEVHHIYPIRHENRDGLKAYLLAKGIKTEIHYPIAPCDQKSIQDIFAKKQWLLHDADFFLAREIHRTILSLPISTIHSEEDVRYVAECINAFEG
ncbi:MAG: DegT/DnrJ/EryC1/StrS family aminotransferase [Bacteroidota bacterium]|nr:DegT/DnrJ/EryC1/StrS family aminotransferase [Bacteroidota bacterium]MDX5429960.1 DegT/DnrJ/EryC1/StrS family aminotransferase [Bacteroidota bacterium]MDX5468733.1 DegT/DnrJ/EryC1/StrS family aminotransferase [Bacteroidota bacterium]